MPKPIIIGITGYARSGKSTTARMIQQLKGGSIYSFATPIKTMLASVGLNAFDPYWDQEENKEKVIPTFGVSFRHLAQTLGTEWGRELINPDIWVNLLESKIAYDSSVQSFERAIIQDVRFENEAAWVRSQGGSVIHIHNPTAIPVREHSSEDGVKRLDEDFVLDNTGSLEYLFTQIEEMFTFALT